MKMKINEDKSTLKLAKKTYRNVSEKILRLETPLEETEDSEVIKFQREFSIPLSGFKFDPTKDKLGEVKGYLERDRWFLELAQDKRKLERYQQRLRDLATHFGFAITKEIDMLEEYLQTGDPIIVHENLSKPKVEVDKWQPTRAWDTAPLARRLKQMRKEGKSYREIAAYYNRIQKSNKIFPTKRVTPIKLRQVISRAEKRLKQLQT